MPNAIVTITIQPFTTPFVSPGTPPTVIKPYDIADTFDPAGRLVVDPPIGPGSAQGGPPPYKDGEVKVTGSGNIKLTFQVVDTATPPAQYIVCGLLFSEIKTAGLEAMRLPPNTGRDVFTDFTCDASGNLTVENAKTASARYHFLLLIQNLAGGVGIVDPQISNQ